MREKTVGGGNYPESLLNTNVDKDEKLGDSKWQNDGRDYLAAPEDPPIAAATAAGGSSPWSTRILRITNRFDFLSLDHLSAEWRLQSCSSGGYDEGYLPGGDSFPLKDIAPGDYHDVSIALGSNGHRKADGGRGIPLGMDETFLHVEVKLSSNTPWAQAGHVVAWGCFPVAPVASAAGDVLGTRIGEEQSGADLGMSLPPAALIAYDDENEQSVSSRDGSPMGQL